MHREDQGCSLQRAMSQDVVKPAAWDGINDTNSNGHHSRDYRYHRLARPQGAPPLFAKQRQRRATYEHTSPRREEQLHQIIQEDKNFMGLRHHVPVCFGYDETTDLLIFEFLEGYQSLEQLFLQHDWCCDVASQLGATIGSLHSIDAESVVIKTGLPAKQPWVLSLLQQAFNREENVTQGMLEYVQQLVMRPVIAELLNTVQQHWQVDGLVHHSLTPKHVLVCRQQGDIKLTNWELTDIGDTAWDIGTVLQSYLLQPTLSGDLSPAYTRRHTSWHLPLQASYSPLTGFIAGYFSQRQLSSFQQQKLLIRALHCCAARMVLTGYEQHLGEKRLLPTTTALLNLAVSVFAEPESIALSLLRSVMPDSEKLLA